jgi:predicted nucleic acid-binding protein
VKVYFDTSVLVAALIVQHPHHETARPALLRARENKVEAFLAAHGLAELYATLTRLPLTPPVFPAEAWRMISAGVLPAFRIVSLSGEDYRAVIDGCAALGWKGGMVYDALHLRAAENADCERVFTFNVRDFHALAGERFRAEISVPRE